jgi:hypothetical protein
MRDVLLSIALGIAFMVGAEYAYSPPPPPPKCPAHDFMCCRTFTEEPDCSDAGALVCRPGFERCDVEGEDAGGD